MEIVKKGEIYRLAADQKCVLGGQEYVLPKDATLEVMDTNWHQRLARVRMKSSGWISHLPSPVTYEWLLAVGEKI